MEVLRCDEPLRPVEFLGGAVVQAPAAAVNPTGAKGRVLHCSWDGDTCVVQTFGGLLFELPASALQEFEPPPPEEGGFDLCWPHGARHGALAEFAEGVAGTLAQRGYCVAQAFAAPAQREAAVDEAYDIAAWQLPKAEFADAYLGRASGDKYAMLPSDDLATEPRGALAACDRGLTEVSLALEPLARPFLGFGAWGRLNGLVRIPLAGAAEERSLRPQPLAHEDYRDGRVVGHLQFLERRRLLILRVIESDGGVVHLFRRGESEEYASLPLSGNQVLFLRHDLYGYSYRPKGFSLALQAWLLSEAPAPDLEADGIVALPMQLHGDRAHVMSLTSRYPGDSFGPTSFWMFLLGGGDGLVRVPICRWDVFEYYSEERTTTGTTYAMHGGFCSDACVVEFDNDFFAISPGEAERMSPGQRVVLETGFEVLHRAGHSRDTARGLGCGVFLGDSGNDWPFMCTAQDAFRMTSQSNCITGARLSHSLGLRGPVSTTDTACSSSLVAVCLAHTSLRPGVVGDERVVVSSRCTSALALGSGLILSPRMYVLYCGPGMLSPRGRCFTYDSSADGYARGEGCGGMLMQFGNKDEDAEGMLACLIGSAVNQDGRSASMTAPNGPAQQTCIRTSMSESGLVASEITVAECHGTGTALGDPIEVSALRAVMEDRERPILNTSAKTNIGHLEAAAGLAGLIKCVLMLTSSTGPPNAHLRLLNPHMDVNGYPVYFESELSDYGGNNGISGVSSFGFGGTNARGDLWGRSLRGARATLKVGTLKWLEQRSMTYHRVFHYGAPGPHTSDRICIVGSWDAYRSSVEMDRVAPNTWACLVMLGEARREQFRILVNGDASQAIHPESAVAPRGAPALGPDAAGAGKTWLIDGRSDQTPQWTLYKVQFDWGFDWEHGEYKAVSWEATIDVASATTRRMFERHTYSVVATWTAWGFEDMDYATGDPGLWTLSAKIGMSGREEFQIVRDRDWNQAVYPAAPSTSRPGVPIRGPDAAGCGKNWLLVGDPGEVVRIRLRIADGEIAVTTSSGALGERTWRSLEDDLWTQHFVTGSWNNWGFSAMTHDDASGVYRYALRLGASGAEEFHLVIDKDWGQQLYPDCERAELGEGLLCGPDADGHGLNWLISGYAGAEVEILFDADARDRSLAVTWREVEPPALLRR